MKSATMGYFDSAVISHENFTYHILKICNIFHSLKGYEGQRSMIFREILVSGFQVKQDQETL